MKSKLKQYSGGYVDGDIPCEVCQKTDNYPYWRTWIELKGFGRGDDEVNGNICDECYQKLLKPSLPQELSSSKRE